jgi:hypothetical protein
MLAAITSLTVPEVAFASGTQWLPVSFYQNDSPTDQTVAGQISNAPTTLTLFDDMDPSFANRVITYGQFHGWLNSFDSSHTNPEWLLV